MHRITTVELYLSWWSMFMDNQNFTDSLKHNLCTKMIHYFVNNYTFMGKSKTRNPRKMIPHEQG